MDAPWPQPSSFSGEARRKSVDNVANRSQCLAASSGSLCCSLRARCQWALINVGNTDADGAASCVSNTCCTLLKTSCSDSCPEKYLSQTSRHFAYASRSSMSTPLCCACRAAASRIPSLARLTPRAGNNATTVAPLTTLHRVDRENQVQPQPDNSGAISKAMAAMPQHEVDSLRPWSGCGRLSKGDSVIGRSPLKVAGSARASKRGPAASPALGRTSYASTVNRA